LCVLCAHFGGIDPVGLQHGSPAARSAGSLSRPRLRGGARARHAGDVGIGLLDGYELDHVGRSPRTLSFVLGALFCLPGVLWLLILARWHELPAAGLA
jgi:hypothetical protein